MDAITLRNPYQLFGTEVPEGMTAAEALDMAGLSGWNQRLIEPIVTDGLTEYPAGKHRFNVADLPIGPRVLGAVKESYRPIQNEEAFLPLLDGFQGKGLTPLILGAYDNGAASFIQFLLPDGGTGTMGGDEVKSTLIVAKRNDGTGAVLGYPASERIRCANELSGIAKKNRPVISVRHTRHADPYVVQTAERLLGITEDWDGMLRREVERLASVPLTYADFLDSFVPALLGDRPEDDGRGRTIYENKAEALADAWHSPVSPEGDTGWRAWNAVSYFEQHARTTNESRMALSVLHGRQPLTDKAMALLS
jgi:hypothetical protein